MLCDTCHEREATVHTTHCTNIADDVPKQQHLCNECFEASSPNQASELTAALDAGCRYCRGTPGIGGADAIAGMSGVQKISFMCRPCAEEYHRFLALKLPGFGKETITDEQIATIRTHDFSAILAELEKHMKKWVSERDSQ
jgi:protein-arginine kinase activator protein McsA